MSMSDTIGVLNQMVNDGVISRYAIGGAVAAYAYVEASSTEDLDVLVSFDGFETSSKVGLVTLGPIISYLADAGFSEWRQEGVVVHGWPVQFLPVSNPLSAESLEEAVVVDLEFVSGKEKIQTRILSAEHVMATALQIGRAKDKVRLSQFIESQIFDMDRFCNVISRHGLMDKWADFCDKFEIKNECLRT
jgi:hypothetical protein